MALKSRCWAWCLFSLVLGQRFVVGQPENCASGIVSSQNWQDEDIQGYLLMVNSSSEVGYQVLIPGMRFNCHGVIRSWSALTVLNEYQATIRVYLTRRLYFQLWRPTENGLYKLIDNDHLMFEQPELFGNVHRLGGPEPDIGVFRFTGKRGKGMHFQPGDVLGYFTPSQLNTNTRPLGVTFRNASMNEANASLVVDMYSVSSRRQLCEMSECGNMVTLHSRVVPNIAVQYEETQPNATTSPTIRSCSSTSLIDCRLATMTSMHSTLSPLSPLSTSTPAPCTDPHGCQLDPNITILLIALIPASFAVILIIALGIVALCVTQRKRITKSLAKRSQTYHNRPTYPSSDDITQLQQPPQVPHWQASNEALYALPNRANRQTASTEDTFDGECYASTYQTKGKIHTYHELSDTSRRTSLLSRASTQVSTVSLPSLPPSPELIENPHAAKFPYVEVESQPTTTQPVSYSQPVMRRISAPSFPYVEPAIPRATTEKTGTQKRKLLHALDEEGFHVPTAEERGRHQGKSTKDIYLKLARPHFRSHNSRETIFFEQADLYWEPPSSAAELYNQLAKRKYREIKRDQVRVRGCIGSGHFGTVHKGAWKVPGGSIDVAVKTLKVDASDNDKVVFLREAAIMGQFLHPNVVKLYGVVTVGEPLMIVLELMPKGDLKEYLRSLPKNRPASLPRDLPNRLLNFCQQIAVGMNYLANKAFVHRDLAARNIFLTGDLICKIGDFGMTRDLANDSVYHSQGGKVPLKWTAPEALNYRKFSSASDVWSFGMVLFEIWSLGHTPFEKISTTTQLVSLLDCGHCQPPPPGCPRAIYQLMVQCWNPTSRDRPSFSEICGYLNASDDQLLNWTSQDKMVSERVAQLGAPHSEARNLYPDLQYTYNAF